MSKPKTDAEAKADIPILRRFLVEMMDLVYEMGSPSIKHEEDDDMGFMAACFLYKQFDHAKALLHLLDGNYNWDANVVARSMLEGQVMLMWTGKKGKANLWRSYAWVEDYYQMVEQERDGIPIPKEKKEQILEGLSKVESEFLTKDAKNAAKQGLPRPDRPYRSRWVKRKVWEMFDDIGLTAIYEKSYRDASKWSHWNTRGIGLALKRTGGNVKYSQESPMAGAKTLITAFQALWETTKVVNGYFKLGFDSKLKDLHDRYITELSDDRKP